MVDFVHHREWHRRERLAWPAEQVAAADRLLVTKTDLVDAEQVGAVHEALARINPSAEVWSAQAEPLDVDRLLRVESVRASGYVPTGYTLSGTATPTRALPPRGGGDAKQEAGARHASLRRHSDAVSSFSLILAQPLDWTAFGIWLSLLLHRHGDDVLRVKGILQIQGSEAPVFLNAVQHVVHPPQHLDGWPTDDHRSRLVFITRGLDSVLLKRSLEAFCGSPVAEVALA